MVILSFNNGISMARKRNFIHQMQLTTLRLRTNFLYAKIDMLSKTYFKKGKGIC